MKKVSVIEPSTSPDHSNIHRPEDPLIVKHKFSIADTISFLKQRLVYVVLILTAIGVAAYSQNPEWFGAYDTKASANTAQIAIQPAQASATPDTALQLWTTTSAPTGFIQVEIAFTPAVLKLSSDIILTNTDFTRIIKQTPYAEANTTGKIVLVLGLDPAKRTTPPQGTMQIATLPFTAVLPAVIPTTQVTVSGSGSTIVSMDTTLMGITATGSTISLPIPTPTPTNSPTPTPTLLPTPTTTPTSTPTRTPTPTSTPTRTPTPTPVITTYPSPSTTIVPTSTNTPTMTPTKTPTPTITPLPTNTPMPTITNSPTPTPTPIPPEEKGILSGTVLNADRIPIAGATVDISQSVGSRYVRVARLQTDASGKYQITLSYGTYRIKYSAKGYYTQTQTILMNTTTTDVAIYLNKNKWSTRNWFSL